MSVQRFIHQYVTHPTLQGEITNTSLVPIFIPKMLADRDEVLAWILLHLEHPIVHLSMATYDVQADAKLGTDVPKSKHGYARAIPYSNLVRVPGATKRVLLLTDEYDGKIMVGAQRLIEREPRDVRADSYHLALFPHLMDLIHRHTAYGSLAKLMSTLLSKLIRMQLIPEGDLRAAVSMVALTSYRCPMPNLTDGNTYLARPVDHALGTCSRTTACLDWKMEHLTTGRHSEYIGMQAHHRPEDYSLPAIHPVTRAMYFMRAYDIDKNIARVQQRDLFAANMYINSHDLSVCIFKAFDHTMLSVSVPLVGWLLDPCIPNRPSGAPEIDDAVTQVKRRTLSIISFTTTGREMLGGQCFIHAAETPWATVGVLLGYGNQPDVQHPGPAPLDYLTDYCYVAHRRFDPWYHA